VETDKDCEEFRVFRGTLGSASLSGRDHRLWRRQLSPLESALNCLQRVIQHRKE
jgi:hypothetical protein